MKWSIPIGRYAGIPVQVHVTFFALLIWIGVSVWTSEGSAAAVLSGVGFIMALFLCVLLHEFGHALTARRFGVRTRDITLLPIGGLARLERMPDKPQQELLVAVAGPAVNIVIAIGLLIVLQLLGRPFSAEAVAADASLGGPAFLERLLAVNILLVLFNMLPAFPMDGGRVLRALLAMRLDYAVATARAASVGKLFAAAFAVLGFFTNPFLMLIALFVWVGASQEAAAAEMKGVLDGIPVSHAMLTDFRVLSPSDPLSHAVELLLAGSQQDFPVLDGQRVLGVLSRQALLTALARRTDHQQRVVDAMDPNVPHADANEPLEAALPRLQVSPVRTLPVVTQGQLVGLLTMENVGEFVSVHAALARTR
jgi:Zn-dependent protease/predicted transcriptional regulator